MPSLIDNGYIVICDENDCIHTLLSQDDYTYGGLNNSLEITGNLVNTSNTRKAFITINADFIFIIRTHP
jgi:hypothetical protein